jgi:hypothetical protein
MALPSKVYPVPEPDPFARNVRAACGALLGVLLGAGFWLRCGPLTATEAILALTVSVLVCVAGAVRYGDSFWYAILQIFRFS